MRLRRAVVFALFPLLAAALCGCAPLEEQDLRQAPAAVAGTAVPTAEPLQTPLQTPTPAPTATPAPTDTPVPTATPVPDYVPADVPEQEGLYKLVVYFGTQSVAAYRAENGRWVTERVMICSTGKTTPEGAWRVHTKYRYHSLFGARGQYCCRIIDHFLFHSVPIDENARRLEDGKQRMKLEEYEKLGTRASDGCVRLSCIDAKWIYDNCDRSTVVVMTAADGPVPTAPPALIAGAPYETEPGYGWDPTDPDPDNPYHAVYGPPEETLPESAQTPAPEPAQ